MATVAAPMPTVDPFQQAHQDAQNAVATFLPSLTPQPPAPPPPPPSMASPKIQEAVRAMSIVKKVEMTSARVARGLPPEPPPPPSPQEQFPPSIDQVHIRAMAAAIAAHPETDRPALLHEAHQNIVKWIAAHNGQIVHDGHIEIANSPQSAENLAAKIINEAVDQHDERRAALSVSMESDGKKGTGVPGAGAGKEKQLPGGVSGRASGSDQPQRSPQVGGTDPDTGRTVTQSSPDLDEAQDTATAAAPELKDTLGQAVDGIPDAEVDGVREEKDPERAQQKEEVDEKPVHTQTDLLAGRIAVDSPEAKDAVVDQLKSSAPVIDEDDKFDKGDPAYGFRSHTLQVALGKGKTSAEVQVVPKEIADVDDDTHDTYERGRQAEAEGDDKTAKEAMEENKSAHDDAMDKFNERNQDRSSKIVEALKGAGFAVRGQPKKIGGHLFVPVVDDDGE
jgi:hypothetical protein